MNKKGQNGTMNATAQEGDCGLNSHQRQVGITDAPVQPNLLLEYRDQPRLSDGANITFDKMLIMKKEKNKKRRLGNAHLSVL